MQSLLITVQNEAIVCEFMMSDADENALILIKGNIVLSLHKCTRVAVYRPLSTYSSHPPINLFTGLIRSQYTTWEKFLLQGIRC